MLCVLYVFMSHVPNGILVGSFEHGGRGVPVSTVSFLLHLCKGKSLILSTLYSSRGIGLRLFIFPLFCLKERAHVHKQSMYTQI